MSIVNFNTQKKLAELQVKESKQANIKYYLLKDPVDKVSFSGKKALSEKDKKLRTLRQPMSDIEIEQLQKNFLTHYVDLTNKEAKAIDLYARTAHSDINDYLRKLGDFDSTRSDYVEDQTYAKSLEKIIASLDSAINKSTVNREITVFRGIKANDPQLPTILQDKGTTFIDDGYMSTSLRPKVAKSYTKEDGFILEVRIPKGQNALDITSARAQRPIPISESAYELPDDGAWSQNEAEILLPKGTKFRIASTDIPNRRAILEIVQ